MALIAYPSQKEDYCIYLRWGIMNILSRERTDTQYGFSLDKKESKPGRRITERGERVGRREREIERE